MGKVPKIKLPKKNVDVGMIFPNHKLWAILRKAWKAFKIAKVRGDKKAMEEWRQVIVDVRSEMRKRGML